MTRYIGTSTAVLKSRIFSPSSYFVCYGGGMRTILLTVRLNSSLRVRSTCYCLEWKILSQKVHSPSSLLPHSALPPIVLLILRWDDDRQPSTTVDAATRRPIYTSKRNKFKILSNSPVCVLPMVYAHTRLIFSPKKLRFPGSNKVAYIFLIFSGFYDFIKFISP